MAAVAIGVAGSIIFGVVPWLILQLIDDSLTIV